MRRAGLPGALALLVVVNAVVLGGVAWNRAGQPEATLQLSERELPLHSGFARSEEDSGLALRLTVFEGGHSLDWLDEQKLRTLGFQPERYYATDESEPVHYKRPLPRRAWVVLELDGPAWQAALAQSEQQLAELHARIESGETTLERLEYRIKSLERMQHSGSRLVAVDAGTDPAALRASYSDTTRYLIGSAEVRIRHGGSRSLKENTGKPELTGSVRLLSTRLHVPRRHRAALQSALGRDVQDQGRRNADEPAPPRYAVVVNYGARHEPWVADIVALKKD